MLAGCGVEDDVGLVLSEYFVHAPLASDVSDAHVDACMRSKGTQFAFKKELAVFRAIDYAYRGA